MDEDTMNVPGQTCGDAGGEPRTALPAGSRWDSGNRAFVACMIPNVPRRPRLYGPLGVALQVPRDEEPRLRYPKDCPRAPQDPARRRSVEFLGHALGRYRSD